MTRCIGKKLTIPLRRDSQAMTLRLGLLGFAALFGCVACVKHEDERIHALRTAAEQGDTHAEVELGMEYFEGRRVVRDETEAAKWFRKAAEHALDSVKPILEEPDRLELLSIDWGSSRILDPSRPGTFHGWRVLKTSVVSDPNTRKQLVAAFETGVEGANVLDEAMCFNPRHGIRAVRDGRTADFVICFECRQVAAYVDGKSLGHIPITAYPASTFNEILSTSFDSTVETTDVERR